jgi:hypothetical protein
MDCRAASEEGGHEGRADVPPEPRLKQITLLPVAGGATEKDTRKQAHVNGAPPGEKYFDHR